MGLAVDGTSNPAWRLEFALRRNPDFVGRKINPNPALYKSSGQPVHPQYRIFAHNTSQYPFFKAPIRHFKNIVGFSPHSSICKMRFCPLSETTRTPCGSIHSNRNNSLSLCFKIIDRPKKFVFYLLYYIIFPQTQIPQTRYRSALLDVLVIEEPFKLHKCLKHYH
jgi:hypothetical protein